MHFFKSFIDLFWLIWLDLFLLQYKKMICYLKSIVTYAK